MKNLNNITCHFDYKKSEVIERFITFLCESTCLLGLFVGGSCIYSACDIYSDLDLFCMVEDGKPNEFEIKVATFVERNKDVRFTVYGQYYQWFGRLTTIYWKEPLMFSIDVGCIERQELTSFFVEPNAVILIDKFNEIKLRQEKIIKELIKCREDMIEINIQKIFILIYKIRKSIHRGHLWSAFEYISKLRSSYIWLLREEYSLGLNHPLFSRPEKNFEDYAPKEILYELAFSIPDYTRESIIKITNWLVKNVMSLSIVRNRERLWPILNWANNVLETEFLCELQNH